MSGNHIKYSFILVKGLVVEVFLYIRLITKDERLRESVVISNQSSI